jgi:hypothetical protein
MRWRKSAAEDEWWRVQASWTAGGERRSYRPTYCRGRAEADRTSAELADTLNHFPTLEIEIGPATAEEVEAEREAQAELELARDTAPPEPIHLMLQPGGDAACGVTDVKARMTMDMWNLSSGHKCPQCETIATAGAAKN